MHNRVTTGPLIRRSKSYTVRVAQKGALSLLVRMYDDGQLFVRGPFEWIEWS